MIQTNIQPDDYLLDNFITTITYPFYDDRLLDDKSVGNLVSLLTDEREKEKLRVSAISMVMYITYRGVMEAYMKKFKDYFKDDRAQINHMISATKLFDEIVLKTKKEANMPSYVDDTYLIMWRRRYEARVLEETSPLKLSIIYTFMMQATFEYETQPKVNASQIDLSFYAENIYDNYVIGLRNHLGEGILR